MLSTKIVLEPAEFSPYNVQEDAKLTFCLKELKAAAQFCDFANKPL